MAENQPFADVVVTADGFSIPELKWRELLFTGAVRREGEHYLRDPGRPMSPFADPGLLPEGVRFEVSPARGRVHLKRV